MSGRPWNRVDFNESELEELRQNWAEGVKTSTICKKFGVSKQVIQRYVRLLGLKSRISERIDFNETDLEDLRRDWLEGVPVALICKEFGVSSHIIRRHVRLLGLPIRRGAQPLWFNKTDIEDVRKDWTSGVLIEDIAADFDVSAVTIRKQVKRLGLPLRIGHGEKAWKPEEDALVCNQYRKIPASKIAKMIGRTKSAVISRYHRKFAAAPQDLAEAA